MTLEPAADAHALDLHRDPAQTAFVRGLAAEVTALHGADFRRMRRANGYSNATWVGDGIAVRVTHTPVDLSREVALARALPSSVGHPRILDEGTTGGHGWIVTAEIDGENLHEAWPTLNSGQQQRAVRHLWARAHSVHTHSASLTRYASSHGGYVPKTRVDAMALAGRVESALRMDSTQRSQFYAAIESYFRVASHVEQVVNHGDLALMNAIWDGEVVALLDFEYAVVGPIEIDLCRLVCEARVTEDGQRVDSEAGDAAIEIAAQHMDSRHGPALIQGAAVLDQLRDAGIWLNRPHTESSFRETRPGRLLRDALDSKAGFLAPLLA